MFVIWWGYIKKMGIELDMMGYVWIYVGYITLYTTMMMYREKSGIICPPFWQCEQFADFFWSTTGRNGPWAHLQRNPWTDGLRHFTLSLSQSTRITKEFHGNSWWTRNSINSEPLETFADDSPSNIAMEDGLLSSIIYFTYLKWCSLAIHHTYTSYIYIIHIYIYICIMMCLSLALP